MLWLTLDFPKLPLEAQSERALSRQTAAGAFVIEHGHVCVVDSAAEAAGVMPGMRLSTARGILPEGRVVERDAAAIARERQALNALACFCGNYSASVCQDGALLLLEIGASRRLFGGVGAIVGQLRQGCAERGFTVRCGVAPTPRAAGWLAICDGADEAGSLHDEACCLTADALPEMLARLPLEVLAAGPDVTARLRAFGLRRIGDLMALPRGGLARRIGPAPVEQLMQALGELPDLRAPIVFPEHFRFAIELPAPAADAAMLGFPARRLIADLCGWLAARQSGVSACLLRLVPERRGLPTQTVELRLATASRDPERFLRLLRERLERTRLAAPVGDIALEAGDIVPLPGQNASLLDARRPAAALDVLLERLRARLGEGAVHGLRVQADHRPECASRAAPVGYADALPMPAVNVPRPLALCEPPEALGEINGRPVRRGEALTLLGVPERIESGWWDAGEWLADKMSVGRPTAPGEAPLIAESPQAEGGDSVGVLTARPNAVGDVRRDYFLARSPQGECCWVFRDARGWWLQGVGFAGV